MPLLVTGASGLIGCHATAALLRAGTPVRALVRDEARLARALAPFGLARAPECFVGDVTDPGAVERALDGCDGVIHAAGVFSHDLGDAARLHRTNVIGTETVLGRAAEAGLDPIVHVSSILALFPAARDTLRADDPVTAPRAMYSRTKADAEHVARRLQHRGAPVTTVYPAATQGPDDPTVGSGPAVLADMLRAGRVLVTEGGLPYTDVRDLARLLTRVARPGSGPRRLMAPSHFVPHAQLHALLCELTGLPLQAQRVPGPVLRGLGRLGDLRQRIFGRSAELTHEAALVLTRSVPCDDAEARALLGPEVTPLDRSFRDLLSWMGRSGVLTAAQVGRLGDATRGATPAPERALQPPPGV